MVEICIVPPTAGHLRISGPYSSSKATILLKLLLSDVVERYIKVKSTCVPQACPGVRFQVLVVSKFLQRVDQLPPHVVGLLSGQILLLIYLSTTSERRSTINCYLSEESIPDYAWIFC